MIRSTRTLCAHLVSARTQSGVGIYTFNAYGLETADGVWSTPAGTETGRERTERLRRWTLGAQIVGPHPFFLLAVWAHNEWAFRPVNAAIADHSEQLASGRAIVAGDFNNGCRWDGTTGNKKDHRHTVELLHHCCLVSAYHQSWNMNENVACHEADKTFWSGFNSAKGDHIDFIYAPVTWIDEVVQRPSPWDRGPTTQAPETGSATTLQ